MPSNPAFIFGDRDARPYKSNRTVVHIIRDQFTIQGLVGLGIFLQAILTLLLPQRYIFLPGLIFIAAASIPSLLNLLGLQRETDETAILFGRTAAYLDFASPSHVGKPPGSLAFSTPPAVRPTPKLALMMIGSQCRSNLGALQPEFKEMGEVFANMIAELRSAPPEEDIGFLNAEFYMNGAQTSNNSNMVCIYWRSYEHMYRFAHKAGGRHWPAWEKYRALQRDDKKLGPNIAVWHEVYEVSNAEAIYVNMPRTGLGDMWEPVPTPDGRVVYRNSLVTSAGSYSSSHGRLGYETGSPTCDEKSITVKIK